MAAQPVVQLVPGVWRVPLLGDFVNGFIFRDQDERVTLLDMGLKSHGPKVMAALEAIKSGPSDVTRLLLTHAHADHIGGAAHVAEATGLGFGVHADDAPYARSGTGPPRDASHRLGRLLDRLSPTHFDAVPVEEELRDGQLLPIAGGLRVVHMPGHSPGHCGYLHEPTGLLITGDAIFNVRGIRWPFKSFCTNFAQAQQTVHRLTELDYTTAAFTHGTELRVNPREAIRSFLARS